MYAIRGFYRWLCGESENSLFFTGGKKYKAILKSGDHNRGFVWNWRHITLRVNEVAPGNIVTPINISLYEPMSPKGDVEEGKRILAEKLCLLLFHKEFFFEH